MMQSFLELAKHRFSCRNYQARPVEQEKLDRVLEAGRVAPSAVNLQPWHFYVFRDPELLDRVYRVYHREWFRSAPCVIVLCSDHERSWKRKDGKDHADIDIAIAADHMTLQATDLGLATCWICNFDPEAARELLRLPDHMEPAVILSVGYPLDEADPGRHEGKRRPAGDITTIDPG